MSERINARIGPELARKIERLRERTGKSTTEVLTASIEAYFERVAAEAHPERLLEGYVGCARGAPDLSLTYKHELGVSLRKKARP